ncbi:MAG TPA: TonB-dependent receptor plug domain-containing protein, partial [Candidatus Polarisedimenticolaceae bacterium]|nr:TonB-dependent receptor plug domain-containing protein [Candidatus Polarisedimenticolaceae bacterium]
MMGSRVVLILLLLAVGGLCVPGYAEDEPADEREPDEGAAASGTPTAEDEYIEVNVSYVPKSSAIVSKLPLSQQMTPANVGTVSEALIFEQDGYVLSDALRNVSSLNVQAQAGVHDYFLIRGYDSISGSMVMTDGAIEPEATWYPTYNIVGVEVLKGPSGFLYGVDPLAGVVNIVRKQPLPTNFATFGLSMGSFATGEGVVDWNHSSADGKKNFRLNALGYGTDNWRDVGRNRQYAVNPSFGWQVGQDSQLNFNLEAVRAEFSPDSGIPIVDGGLPSVPRDRSYQTPFDFSDQDIVRFQLDYQTRVNDAVTLRNKFYVRDLDWTTKGTQFLGVGLNPFEPTGITRTLTSLDDDQQYVGNQIEGVFTVTTGPVTHNLLTGLEIRYFTDTFDIGVLPPEDPQNPLNPGVPSIDLFDPVETA